VRPRVICVDDEPRVLKGLRRRFGRDFDLTLAESGSEALEIMRSSEPFDVIVSDMRMPVMSGAQLLATTREEFPDSVRMLLTGQSDLQDAIAAINDGHIFRFLSKPCPPEILEAALEEAVEYNRLIRSERQLLDETISGSVALLTEILAIRDPAAAAKGTRLRDHVGAVANHLGIEHPWDIEVAAALSEIGYALVPSDIVDRWRQGVSLTETEQRLIDQQPRIVRDLIGKIPRLETVGDIVGGLAPRALPPGDPRVQMGINLIQAAIVYDRYLQSGLREGASAQKMRSERSDLPEDILDGFEQVAVAAGGYAIRSIGVADLVSGVRLAEDLYTADGRLLLTAGAAITQAAHARIAQYADHVGIREPIKVRLPR
jgi:CheY-like chemotaxis protein